MGFDGSQRRWVSEHLVAVVECGCGLFVAALGIVLGAQAATALDRAVPYLIAAVGLALVVTGVRRWRAAERRVARDAAARDAARDAATPGAATTGAAAPDAAAPPAPPPRPTPTLSSDGERELARVVAVLAAAGVFSPRPPDPRDLAEAAADHGEPVTAEAALAAMDEADYYHPGFRYDDHTARLAFHASHTEQFPATLLGQADDLVRVAGTGLAGVRVAVEQGAANPADVRLRITSDGAERVLDYRGMAKYLSTVLHVELARILRDRATGSRLAWLWSDQGVWVACLPDGTTDTLNAELGPAAGEGWEWVDEQEPVAG